MLRVGGEGAPEEGRTVASSGPPPKITQWVAEKMPPRGVKKPNKGENEKCARKGILEPVSPQQERLAPCLR